MELQGRATELTSMMALENSRGRRTKNKRDLQNLHSLRSTAIFQSLVSHRPPSPIILGFAWGPRHEEEKHGSARVA